MELARGARSRFGKSKQALEEAIEITGVLKSSFIRLIQCRLIGALLLDAVDVTPELKEVAESLVSENDMDSTDLVVHGLTTTVVHLADGHTFHLKTVDPAVSVRDLSNRLTTII